MLSLSLFTPTHDPRFLLDAWETIGPQLKAHDEWVICPNGSCSIDDIPDPIRKDVRVRVVPIPESAIGDNAAEYEIPGTGKISQPHIGALKAFACAQCRGDVLVEHDHDDLLAAGCLDEIVAAFANQDVVFAYTNCAQFCWPSWKPRSFGWTTRPIRCGDHGLLESVWPPPTANNVSALQTQPDHVRAFRRSAYEQVGGYDPTLAICDDLDLSCRLFVVSKFKHVDRCGCFQRMREDGTGTMAVRQQEMNRIAFELRTKHLPAMLDAERKRVAERVTVGGGSRFRFHVLSAGPHVQTNRDWTPCPFTTNSRNWIKMMAARGHELIHYGNQGSDVPCELVQIFSDDDRQRFYGRIDHSKTHDYLWKEKNTAKDEWNKRAVVALKPRVRRGDFIVAWQGSINRAVADAFPGSWDGDGNAPVKFVEATVGNYNAFSRYRVYASSALREYYHGTSKGLLDKWSDVVIPHYFDVSDFALHAPPTDERMAKAIAEPYYLFVGRVVDSKGYRTAIDAVGHLGARLILSGPGEPTGTVPPHVVRWGYCTPIERRALLANCIALYLPTQYREPFGMVVVEALLSGRPAITTDFGAFPEIVAPEWRCTSMREFVAAGKRAATLSEAERVRLRMDAVSRYSFDAVAPQYERYFSRIHAHWGRGWYDLRSPELIPIPG